MKHPLHLQIWVLAEHLVKEFILVKGFLQGPMPHSRAMGEGLLELRPRGSEDIGRVFYQGPFMSWICSTWRSAPAVRRTVNDGMPY